MKQLVSEKSMFLPFGPPKKEKQSPLIPPASNTGPSCTKSLWLPICFFPSNARRGSSSQVFRALGGCQCSCYVTMDVFHNRRSGSALACRRVHVLHGMTSFTRLKCPSQIFHCARCRVACSSHPTSLEMHIRQSACEPRRARFSVCPSLFFHLFLLFHVWMCSPVTQLGAKPPCLAPECTRAAAGFAIVTALSSLSVPYQGASSHPIPATASVCPYGPLSFFSCFFFSRSGADRNVPTSAVRTDNCADSGWNKVDLT